MATKGVLDPKIPDERIYVTADFTNLFSPGITIASATTTCTRYSGHADPTPPSMISGGTVISGMVVAQLIVGGIVGTNYVLEFSATGSDGSILDIQLLLPVVAVRLG
jgi:hypothetical protein